MVFLTFKSFFLVICIHQCNKHIVQTIHINNKLMKNPCGHINITKDMPSHSPEPLEQRRNWKQIGARRTDAWDFRPTFRQILRHKKDLS